MWCDIVYASACELYFVTAGDNALQTRRVSNANWCTKHDKLDSFDYNETTPSECHDGGTRPDFYQRFCCLLVEWEVD